MATLSGQTIANTFDSILHVEDDTAGLVATSTDSRVIQDGVGEDSALALATDSVRITSTNKLYINDVGGEYISGDATDLTIASGNDMNLTATTDINIPADVGLTFGHASNQKIEGDGTDLSIDATGNINVTSTVDEAASIYLRANAGTSETIKIHADQGSAATSLNLLSDAGGITLNPGTQVFTEGTIKMKEQADADSDTAAYGQVWVNTATPNELYFTTDAGNDIALTSGTSATGGVSSIEMFYPTWVEGQSPGRYVYGIYGGSIDDAEYAGCSGVAPYGFTGISNIYIILIFTQDTPSIDFRWGWQIAAENEAHNTHVGDDITVSNVTGYESSVDIGDIYKKSMLNEAGSNDFEDLIAAGDTFGCRFKNVDADDCYVSGMSIVWTF